MKIAFAMYGNFQSNSALHVLGVVNRLQQRGHRCLIAAPEAARTIRHAGAVRFEWLELDQGAERSGTAPLPFAPDVVVAWTPRELVRRFVEDVSARTGAAIVVHLEDDEEAIATAYLGLGDVAADSHPESFWDRSCLPALSHPYRMRRLIHGAAGVTGVSDALRRFVPPHVPFHVFWPGWNEASFAADPARRTLRRADVRVPEDATIVVYPGNAHAVNAADMRSLYAAVALANRAGAAVRLIRIGRDSVDFLGDLAPVVKPHVVNIGFLEDHRQIASYLALADVVVQPGKANRFNDARFPSKVPEFLVAGKPLVIARTNIGRVLRHAEEAWILENGDSIEIAQAIVTLRDDRALAARLGRAGREFAETRLSWDRTVDALEHFYLRSSRSRGASEGAGRLAG